MSARCNWCGRFVRRDAPAWTWYRAWSRYDSRTGEPETELLGWTEPQRLCPDCAEGASHWEPCHAGVFAEVAP